MGAGPLDPGGQDKQTAAGIGTTVLVIPIPHPAAPLGFSVCGADAVTVLRSQLEQLEQAWTRNGMPHTRWLRPGLSATEIQAALAEVGLPAPEEVVTWFSWHDGAASHPVDGVDPRRAARPLPFLSLSEAIEARARHLEWAASERAVGFPPEEEGWGPLWGDSWLPLVEAAPETMYATLEPHADTVAVTRYSLHELGEGDATLPSLAEVVGLWISAVDEYFEWDRQTGGWRFDFASLPNDNAIQSFA